MTNTPRPPDASSAQTPGNRATPHTKNLKNPKNISNSQSSDEFKKPKSSASSKNRRRRHQRRSGSSRNSHHGSRNAQPGPARWTTEQLAARRAAVPPITFPEGLPVSARAAELAEIIDKHQVVIVAGETGSGKSTQLPKICLQLGRGVTGMIAHTQPRRIAARTLAERIAEETGTTVGDVVGYAVRFTDETGPHTLLKLLTDGLLLAEITRDPQLRRYDTIIIDEAHERSLNIDFLLGFLKRLLPERPDLKVIITSATIDPEKFAAHFAGAPIVEVSGRTYPVEIRYRPYGLAAETDEDDFGGEETADDVSHRRAPATHHRPTTVSHSDGSTQLDAIREAVAELLPAGDGDILVFLSGEREITDTADELRAYLTRRGGLAAQIEVLPLFGRLSMADQHKVFRPTGKRRIVLATNVAETSLTVPGIKYVIDPGFARISRYSTRTKVQRLPIEAISQASAGQRAGRCGRTADGICIRLYSEEDFTARAPFTDPEIARTSLAAVILQMAALRLGDIRDFPFLDPPDSKQIHDGITVLTELAAITTKGGRRGDAKTVRLTAIGRHMARLPVDPRFGRILAEAHRRGALKEALIIIAGLTVRDVREYPLENREKATEFHRRFADKTSDFLSLLNLWKYLRTQSKERSGNGFRKMCRAEYLHYLRFREWQDLHSQLRRAAKDLGWDTKKSAHQTESGYDSRAIHTSLAAGFLSHLGALIALESAKTTHKYGSKPSKRGRPIREYQGSRGTKFAIWPGSALTRSDAEFVLAAELVETSRLWARTVASIDPAWVEAVAGDLLRRSYAEPYWSTKRQAVLASEKVMVLGVTLVAARPVQYDRIDREIAREIFIRHGLVEGELRTHLPFLIANQTTLDTVMENERRARRRDIAIDDETLFALYDERLPADITSGRHLESWWRKNTDTATQLLTFTDDMLIAAGAQLASRDLFPDQLAADGVSLPLDYVFEPGAADDGVSATVPLAALASIDPTSIPAQIPGLRRELAIALIRALPKLLRRSLVPAPDFADAALHAIGEDTGALPQLLATELTRLAGIPISADDFDYSKVPDHLRMRFTVVDDAGKTVATGTDLGVMQRQLHGDSRQAVAKISGSIERAGLTTYPQEGIPHTTEGQVAGATVIGYPALVDEGTSVAIKIMTNPERQTQAMRAGMCRLLQIGLAHVIPDLASHLRNLAAPRGPSAPGSKPPISRADLLQLATAPHANGQELIKDAMTAAIDALLDWAGGLAWDQQAFAATQTRIEKQLPRAVMDIAAATADVLRAAGQAEEAIAAASRQPLTENAVAQMRAELESWVCDGFIAQVGAAYLPSVVRYMKALQVRAQRLAENPARDADNAADIAQLNAELTAHIEQMDPVIAAQAATDIAGVRRMIAEYRITLFAQPMKAAIPVSRERILRAIAALPQ